MCSPTASLRWSMGTKRWIPHHGHRFTRATTACSRSVIPAGATPGRRPRPPRAASDHVSGWRGRPGSEVAGRGWEGPRPTPPGRWPARRRSRPGWTMRTESLEQPDLAGQVQPVDATEQDDSGNAVGRDRRQVVGRTSANTMSGRPALRRSSGGRHRPPHRRAPRLDTHHLPPGPGRGVHQGARPPTRPPRRPSPGAGGPNQVSRASDPVTGIGRRPPTIRRPPGPAGRCRPSSSSTRAARYRSASQVATIDRRGGRIGRGPRHRRPGCRPAPRPRRPRTADRSGPSDRAPTGRREGRARGLRRRRHCESGRSMRRMASSKPQRKLALRAQAIERGEQAPARRARNLSSPPSVATRFVVHAVVLGSLGALILPERTRGHRPGGRACWSGSRPGDPWPRHLRETRCTGR